MLRRGQALRINNGKGGVIEVALDPNLPSHTYFFVRPEQFEQPAVYVPLYEPEGGWAEYYSQKQRNPARTWPSRLLPVRIDGQWVPGIAFDSRSRVRVVRPRLKPPQA